MDPLCFDSQLLQKFKLPILGQGSFFVSFEGLDGSGKSTQVRHFQQLLERQGKKVFVFQEPGGTLFGEQLRQAVKLAAGPLAPLAEAYLFASSRAQLLEEKVLPLLKGDHVVVLLDRYIDSSLVYQGAGTSLGMSTVLSIHQYYPLHFLPQLTFLLCVPWERCVQRLKQRDQRMDYFERKGEAFFQQLSKAYMALAQRFPQRICPIDSSLESTQVHLLIEKSWNDWKKKGSEHG